MIDDEIMNKLIAARDKLDAGEELSEQEQAELGEAVQVLSVALQEFIQVLQETFRPVVGAMAQALQKLWDSIPDSLKEQLREQPTAPDVATPHSARATPGQGEW